MQPQIIFCTEFSDRERGGNYLQRYGAEVQQIGGVLLYWQ